MGTAPKSKGETSDSSSVAVRPIFRRSSGLSADDYIRSHSPTTNSEGFVTAPVSESDQLRGPTFIKRGFVVEGTSPLQEQVDPVTMRRIVPTGDGNLDRQHQGLKEAVMTPTTVEQ
ncbi:hypothetical protein BG004_004144 [Podila humilis]|nr:hypothetical protein BG004_004144 [Podila humilis]